MKCNYLSPKGAADNWSTLKPFIERWVGRGDTGFWVEDVETRLLIGTVTAFVFGVGEDIELVVLTEFINYPRKKALRYFAMIGTWKMSMFRFQKDIEGWAKENGAQEVEALNSPETVCIHKRMGFKPVFTLLKKEL